MPGRERTMRWLRWAGVLPVAILASVAIEYIPEIAFMMVALVLHEAADLIYAAQRSLGTGPCAAVPWA
jgi:hypothetical protein